MELGWISDLAHVVPMATRRDCIRSHSVSLVTKESTVPMSMRTTLLAIVGLGFGANTALIGRTPLVTTCLTVHRTRLGVLTLKERKLAKVEYVQLESTARERPSSPWHVHREHMGLYLSCRPVGHACKVIIARAQITNTPADHVPLDTTAQIEQRTNLTIPVQWAPTIT